MGALPTDLFLPLAAVQMLWIAIGLRRFLRQNDEFILIISGFLAYCGSYRYWLGSSGAFEWTSVEAYGVPAYANSATALRALLLLTIGESLLLTAYALTQGSTIVVDQVRVPESFHKRIRTLLAWLVVLGTIGSFACQAYIRMKADAGIEANSYVQQFPMIFVAIAVLTILVWRFGLLQTSGEKVMALAVLGLVAYMTYQPFQRFRFLAWMLAGAYIISTAYVAWRRVWVLIAGVAFAFAAFNIAGTLREAALGQDNFAEMGMERAQIGEDANFLDGLSFVMQLRPKVLPYQYGMEHLQILIRPIPRALWPGKPLGGAFMQYLGDSTEFIPGISPTLFGSFYEEGGYVGVVVLSIVYGYGLARLVRYSLRTIPFFGVLIRAILVASCIPFLRGGDLPGIYAWVGMSFWPSFLFMWQNRAFLYPEKEEAAPMVGIGDSVGGGESGDQRAGQSFGASVRR